MTAPLTLTHAAVQACVTLNGVIDALFEDENLQSNDSIAELRSELCETYAGLCAVLSREFGTDAHVEIQRYIGAEIGATRAILRAKGVVLHGDPK